MIVLILAFLKDLITGDLMRIWHSHKVQEAINAANDVSRLDDAELDKRVFSDITRKS